MMKGSLRWAAPLVALFLGSSGCTNTVRYMTTLTWMTSPGGATVPSGPGDGTAAQAAPAAAGSDSVRTLYVTYWEGTCSSGLFGFGKGCNLGDSKIRRCNTKPDNTMVCVEEAEATLAFARKK